MLPLYHACNFCDLNRKNDSRQFTFGTTSTVNCHKSHNENQNNFNTWIPRARRRSKTLTIGFDEKTEVIKLKLVHLHLNEQHTNHYKNEIHISLLYFTYGRY